jgi:hypothetical protein
MVVILSLVSLQRENLLLLFTKERKKSIEHRRRKHENGEGYKKATKISWRNRLFS